MHTYMCMCVCLQVDKLMLNLYKNPKGLDIPKTVLQKRKERKLMLVNIKTYDKAQ